MKVKKKTVIASFNWENKLFFDNKYCKSWKLNEFTAGNTTIIMLI